MGIDWEWLATGGVASSVCALGINTANVTARQHPVNERRTFLLNVRAMV